MTTGIDSAVDASLEGVSGEDLTLRRSALLLRILRFPVKLLWGMLFMQSFLGSFLIVGWTNRLARQRALRGWWKKSSTRGAGESFEHFAARHPDLGLHSGWPNWFFPGKPPSLPPCPRWGVHRETPGRPGAWVESLRVNFKSGFQTVLNTWVVTAGPCALWVFAWYFGWNNSFHKGYELSGIGPLTGLVGVFLFIAVMFYLPLAQIRQAVTGDWRSFYELRFIRVLLRESWIACLFLALFYMLLFFPVTILKTLPGFFSNMNPALVDATPTEVRSILSRYFFWSALIVFPAFVALRLAAARIYSSALLRAVRRGSIRESALASVERTALKDLNLLEVEAATPSTPAARLLRGAARL